MRIDVNAFVGSYPFRRVPGTAPDALLAAMDRTGLDQAWVTHLPGVFWRDPTEGNAWLVDCARRHARLRPSLRCIRGSRAGANAALRRGCRRARGPGGPDLLRHRSRRDGHAPAGRRLRGGGHAAGARGALRGRPPATPARSRPELPAAAVRALVRSDARVRLLITHADRPFIEEVHFGSTPSEASRLWWDICWIWGPPEDHLQALLGTIGAERFVLGTGQPLRLPENAGAKLDLLELSAANRAAIESGNARALRGR